VNAPATIFLLSPARCGGPRAQQLVASKRSMLGGRLRDGTATIGDVFAWLSALYFRGKLTYARHFGMPLVMVPGLGLRSPDMAITDDDLRAMQDVEVETDAFARPLRRDTALVTHAWPEARVVLLGSIATGKYTATLLAAFGDRLVFPSDFVGRGDMSRGGLLLRAARENSELPYIPVRGATLHGARATRIADMRR
jgi:hypothetical protein